jgi:AcrR family transcriptional regulator
MPKVTQEYRDARREQILDAARRCFLRDGFHATSMQDLFAESGLSSGAVYRYFASKDDVIIAIAQENIQDVVAMLRTVIEQRPGTSIGDVIADVLAILRAKHEENGLAALAMLVWAEALRNPVLADQFTSLLSQIHEALADVARVHQVAEELPLGVSADALATVLLAIVPGYIVQLALLGPAAVDGAGAGLRALWPAIEI